MALAVRLFVLTLHPFAPENFDQEETLDLTLELVSNLKKHSQTKVIGQMKTILSSIIALFFSCLSQTP